MKTLKKGDQAPAFTLATHDGSRIELEDVLGRGPVVLFFYPVASSGGCTKEACRFRDLGREFGELGAQRLGISVDDVAAQKKFADEQSLDYPLLSDPEGAVATAYGVKRRYITPVKRVTFVIDTDRTIREVITGELKFDVHAEQALTALQHLRAA